MSKKKQKGKKMSVMKIEEIIRLHAKGCSNREVARGVNCSPATVSRYLSELQKLGITLKEAKGLERQELVRLLSNTTTTNNNPNSPDGFLQEGKEIDFEWVYHELRRPGVTMALLWQESRESRFHGYSYSHLCALFRKWSAATKQTWMRQHHKAGDKVFVDFSGTRPVLVNKETGEVFHVELFVGVLGASNLLYAEATESQALSCWIRAHTNMLTFFGGAPQAVVPDNLAAGVTHASYYDPVVNETYLEWAVHNDVAVLPTRTRHPKDKGKVERGVLSAQRWILARLRDEIFFDLVSLNARIRQLFTEFNSQKILKVHGMSRSALFELIEKKALKPLPLVPYEYAEWKKAKVHPDSHIALEHHFYSVPYAYCGKYVEVRKGDKLIRVFYQGTPIAQHLRSKKRGHFTTVDEHLPPRQQAYKHSQSLENILSWATDIGAETKEQVERICNERRHHEQGIRASLGVIRLAKKHSPAIVEAACCYANAHSLVGYRVITNIIDHKKYLLLEANAHSRHTAPSSCSSSAETHEHIRGKDYFN